LPKHRHSGPVKTEPGARSRNAPEVRLERQQEALRQRLKRVHQKARQSPGYKTALRLLGQVSRKGSLATRLAILDAATFMIDVLEMIPPFM
jgi:hypothetical protein